MVGVQGSQPDIVGAAQHCAQRKTWLDSSQAMLLVFIFTAQVQQLLQYAVAQTGTDRFAGPFALMLPHLL